MTQFQKSVLANIAVVIFGVIGAKALLHPGFYTSHDGEHQIARLYFFDQGLRDGQLPVRYSRQAHNELGYPLFTFTYQIPFMVGEGFHFFGLSFADSTKATFFITYLLSGLAMFWFASRWGALPGLVAAILYLWTPYRFVVMFVRSALGEHVAFVFAPLLFGALDSRRAGKKRTILGGIALAGLLLSHAMIAQVLLFPLLIWMLFHFFLTTRKKKYLIHLIGVGVLGVSLSAYYFIPAMVYRKFIQGLNPFFFLDHFVTVRQLLYSPWGYGFSMRGTEQDAMSFQVGAAQWLTIGAFIIVLALAARRVLSLQHRPQRKIAQGAALVTGTILAIFFMTKLSLHVWETWRHTITIDIPWRFLFVTTVETSVLGGLIISMVKNRLVRTVSSAVLLCLALYENRNYLRVNKYIDIQDIDVAAYRGTTNTDDEYRPAWDDSNLSAKEHPRALISNGRGRMSVLKSDSRSLRLAIDSDTPIRLDMNTLYFPGWQVLVDGQPHDFKYQGEGGIMRVEVGSAPHIVEARFRETGIEKASDFLTLTALALLIVTGIHVWKQKNHGSSL